MNRVFTPLRNGGVNVMMVKVTPEEIPPVPDRYAARYQLVVLNVATGELTWSCSDWRPSVSERVVWSSPEQWSTPVGELVRWVADADPDAPADVQYLSAEQANEFVASLVPLAQALVDNLFRVNGRDDFEWSAESATAMRDIEVKCWRDGSEPTGRYSDLVNYHDAIAACPDGAPSEKLRVDLSEQGVGELFEELVRQCVRGPWRAELLETFGGAPSDDGTSAELTLLGVRAWAYANRPEERRQNATRIPIIGAKVGPEGVVMWGSGLTSFGYVAGRGPGRVGGCSCSRRARAMEGAAEEWRATARRSVKKGAAVLVVGYVALLVAPLSVSVAFASFIGVLLLVGAFALDAAFSMGLACGYSDRLPARRKPWRLPVRGARRRAGGGRSQQPAESAVSAPAADNNDQAKERG